ncbi:MAG TPA: hypothetical protein VFV99_23795 [Kofleriaceae bacterium]|nr:hypothetical protein [Kofleriaceae bacterium]
MFLRCTVVLLVVAACGGSPASMMEPAPDGDGDGSSSIDATPLPADPCGGMTAACPTVPAGFGRGDGLRAIDHCAFPMTDRATWDDRGALIDALPQALTRVPLADIATDLNRTGVAQTAAQVPGNPPGVTRAFAWQSGDESVTYWIPQGIAGSFEARDDGVVAGKKLVLVSWYYDIANDAGSTTEKGVRIAIVDATNAGAPTYRFALLVEPVARDGRTDFAPVKVHAGGLAWYGDLLYVPVTGSGFRVFDLSRILRIDGTEDRLGYNATTGTYNAHGYRYAIPQIGEYIDAGACNMVFSYVALDRTSTPHSLISGEYDATTVNGRVFRWPLDPSTGRLQLTDAQRVVPDGVWFAGESHVQGGLAHDNTFWLSSSQPAGSAGALYRARVNMPSTTLGWIDSPEDLAFDPKLDAVWSLSEATNARSVIAVRLDAID